MNPKTVLVVATAFAALCPNLVAAFCPVAISMKSLHSCTSRRLAAGAAPAGAQALRSSASGLPDSLGSGAMPSVFFLTAVLGMDVDKCTRLLTQNGATNVLVEDADYGSKVVASIEVEALARMAPEIALLVKPSGRMGLSGVRSDQTAAVVEAFSPFFDDVKQIEDDDSMRITAWRKDPWMVAGFSSLNLAKEREATKTDSSFWKWDKVIAGQNNPLFKEE